MPFTPHPRGTLLQQGRYRVDALLGQGGQGVVYAALHSSLGERVAIKALLRPDADSREHLLWQARVLLRLNHAALPRVIDFFEEGGQPYLVMEFIEGEDLSQRVEREGALPTAQVLAWADAVLDALAYLHGQEPALIHRDLKPANLKLAPNGRIFLVDFGLSKVGGLNHSTMMVARGYTQGYSPPEQYGQARSDARSDLYALGATLYFLLTGHAPLPAMQRASGQPMAPLRRRAPHVPGEVAAWVERAMALNRDERWPDARAMRAALAPLAVDDAPLPPMPNRWGLPPSPTAAPSERLATAPRAPSHRSGRARRLAWPIGTALGLLLLAGLGLFALRGGGGQRPSAAPQPSATPRSGGIAVVTRAGQPSPRPDNRTPATVPPTRPPATATAPPPTPAPTAPAPAARNVTVTLVAPLGDEQLRGTGRTFRATVDGWQSGDQFFLLISQSPNPPLADIAGPMSRSGGSNFQVNMPFYPPAGPGKDYYWPVQVNDSFGTVLARAQPRPLRWEAPLEPTP